MGLSRKVFADGLLKAAVGAMALGFIALAAQPAEATTVITINDTSASISCSGSADPACQGFTQSGSPGAPTGLGTLGSTADLFHLADSSPATETAALNTLAGTSFLSTDQTTIDTGSASSFSIFTDALYFMIKIGGGTLPDMEDHAFFKLLVPGTVEVVYDANGQTSGGLSHVAVWGGSITPVPLPAALPLFAGGLAGLGWLSRRKKRKQLPA
jgi:hypothetical protein